MSFYDPRPIPDPRKAISASELGALREISLIPPSLSVFPDEASWIAATGVGAAMDGPGKRWRDNDAINAQSATGSTVKEGFERYYAIPAVDASGNPIVLDIYDTAPGKGMSDVVTWGVYGPSIAAFVRESKLAMGNKLRPELEKLPALQIIKLDGAEAARLSFSGATSLYPLFVLVEDATGGLEYDGKRLLNTGPADKLLRFDGKGWIEVVDIYHYPDPPKAVSQTTTTAAATAPPTAPKPTAATSSSPRRLTSTGVEIVAGMGFDHGTGGAVRLVDHPGEKKPQEQIPTDWTFDWPTGASGQRVDQPWGYATQESVDRLVTLFNDVMRRDSVFLNIDTGTADIDPLLGISEPMRQIVFVNDTGKRVVHNAGLIASEIARIGDAEAIIRDEISRVQQEFSRLES